LGKEFAESAENNNEYRELADQRVQNKLLFIGRIDAVIADRYKFQWNASDPSVTGNVAIDQEVTHHRLFDPSYFRAVFKDPKVCIAFNIGPKRFSSIRALSRNNFVLFAK
jgi:polar amino acid transport system substrate-binding protein